MIRLFLTLWFFFISLVVSLHGADLVGTRASLQRQNLEADREGLVRIRDDRTLDELKRLGVLVKLPETVRVDHRLDDRWRWVLPQASTWLEDTGIDFINEFGRFFQTNSAVRTIPRQLELSRIFFNINAAPVEGDRSSPHLTGATVDITKLGMSRDELEWMRKRLIEEEDLDLIEATEEWQQSVFHVMVFKAYMDKKTETRSSK